MGDKQAATGVAGFPSPFSKSVRERALELAIETLRSVRQFTPGQVVNTARVYEQYLVDGTVPPLPNNSVPQPEGENGSV